MSTRPQGSGSSRSQDKGILPALTPNSPWAGVSLWRTHRTPFWGLGGGGHGLRCTTPKAGSGVPGEGCEAGTIWFSGSWAPGTAGSPERPEDRVGTCGLHLACCRGGKEEESSGWSHKESLACLQATGLSSAWSWLRAHRGILQKTRQLLFR